MVMFQRIRIQVSIRLLMVGTFMLASPSLGLAKESTQKPHRVLFICQAGTVKSPIARELLKRRANERGISVTAFSRGIEPAQHVTPELQRRLQADQIQTLGDPLSRLKSADLKSADLIVTFHDLPTSLPLAPKQKTKIQNWASVPSMNDAYAVARADLDKRIELLLDALAAKGRAPKP